VCSSDLFGLRRREPLGRMLVRAGVISEQQLRAALAAQRTSGRRLGRVIVEQKLASESAILQAIARHYRISVTSLSDDFAALLAPGAATLRQRLASLRIPIRVKLSIAITFMVCLTLLTLSAATLMRQREWLYALTVRTGTVSLNYVASDAALPLVEDDVPGLNRSIKATSSIEGLAYASIADRSGVIRAHTDTSRIGRPQAPLPAVESTRVEGPVTLVAYRGPGGEHLMNLSRPVVYATRTLGEASVGISLDFVDQRIRRESLTLAAIALLMVAVGIGIAIAIGVGFARPIAQLASASGELVRGSFSHRPQRLRGDEFGDLTAAFNQMSHELWRKLVMARSFGSYVSPEVLEMVLADPEGNLLAGGRREVTVLFADVRGFTAYVEATPPERVVEAINEYFEIATRHIRAHGGYVDKFIGDAVLGVFGAPLAQPDHARRAVAAADAMQRELLAAGADRNPLLARVGIAINSGVAVAGDLGSEAKRQYSVVGDCVNVAWHLVALAAPGRIVASRSTLDAAGGGVEATPLPPARFKGKSETVEVFEIARVHRGPEGAT
jgi:adenylate cyclase